MAVDGPYGIHRDTSRYGTLLLFASDIGIAAQTSLIKETLHQRALGMTSNRHIVLIWQIEKEGID